tara:strand:- start:41 stop:490 length:450 start_codon:yes stop_codon:yes gene_type:complete
MKIVDLTVIATNIPISGEVEHFKLSFRQDEDGYMGTELDELYKICPEFQAIYELLSSHEQVGILGRYKACFNASIGIESYLPMEGADPVGGMLGQTSLLQSLRFQTYAQDSVAQHIIDQFIIDLAQLHPWEHPVIEAHKIKSTLPNMAT